MATTNKEMDMRLVLQCQNCGKTKTVEVNAVDFAAWQKGKLIQDALGYLSVEERELLISSLCSSCFDEMCYEDVDDYDGDENLYEDD